MTIRIRAGKALAALILVVAGFAGISAFQRYQQVQHLESFASANQADKALIEAYTERVRAHHYIFPLDQADMGELLQSFGPAALYRLDKINQAAGA